MAVEYVKIAQVPGVDHFRCERLRAVLAVTSCANMWRQANRPDGNCGACRGCPIGTEHAGEAANATQSPFHQSKICARCHRPATRLIGRMHCVSCKNREYELDRGCNAKGTKPVKLGPLVRRRIQFTAGGQPCALAIAKSLDTSELIVAVLRDSGQRVRFGLGVAAQPALRQLRLF